MASQKQPEYRINLRPYRILYWPFMLPLALLLALFNKLSPVPFKIYAIRVDRIGQMSGNQEEFLCELDLGMHPREYRVFVHRDHPSNAILLGMFKRVMPIRQIFLPLFDVCHKLGGLGVSSMMLTGYAGADWKHLTAQTDRHIEFNEEENEEARRQCHALGINPDSPFVPVLGRDSFYLSQLGEPTDVDSYRNVDINTFTPAMEFLANRFQVMRMGSVVKDKLQTSHPNIIDYSLSGKRSELLDVYLPAKCHFFLSCGSGIDAITKLNFRRPVLYVNYIPPIYAPNTKANSMIILKNYWKPSENRYLNLSELLAMDIAHMHTPRELNPLGIVIHDNSPEDILDVVREMTARLDGTWKETPEEKNHQIQFWSHFKKHSPDHICAGHIGAKFLKDNPHWLK